MRSLVVGLALAVSPVPAPTSIDSFLAAALDGTGLTRPATARKKVEGLTPRERDVLALVGRGAVEPGDRAGAAPGGGGPGRPT